MVEGAEGAPEESEIRQLFESILAKLKSHCDKLSFALSDDSILDHVAFSRFFYTQLEKQVERLTLIEPDLAALA